MFIMTAFVTSVASAENINTAHNNSSGGYQFMPWICQFCGNQTNYTQMIEQNHHLFTDLSYEQYYLAENGTFQSLGVKDLVGMANKYDLKAFPMIISSSPSTMHLLFTDSGLQTKFISTAVQVAIMKGYAGYNIDFEVPYYSDSAKVTQFIANFSNAMNSAGKQLTLDVIGFHGFTPSSYGSAYNYSALSNTSVSKIVVEDYYAMSDFEQAVNFSVAHVAMNKLMLALPDYGYAFYVDASSKAPFPNNLVSPYVNYSYSGMYGALKGILKTARMDNATVTHNFSTFYGESYYEVIYKNHPNLGNEFYYVGYKGMQLRLHYLESKGIKQAGLWRAGSVDPSIFSSISQYKQYSSGLTSYSDLSVTSILGDQIRADIPSL